MSKRRTDRSLNRSRNDVLCKPRWYFAALSVLAVVFSVSFFCYQANAASDPEKSKEVDILFTHDLHSCLESYVTTRGMQNGTEPVEAGGFARLKTVIDEARAVNPDTLVVDAGDFPMGTLYQVLFDTDAPELRMMGRLGFDATTFGNHDFDYGSEALANMFLAAAGSGDPKPAFVINNFDFSSYNTGSKMIYDALNEYGFSEYVVLQKGDVKIAVFGTLGYDAIDCAPRCELTWLDPIECSKKTVEKIKANEDVDMIVCLSHCGISSNPKKSEDEILAKKVPDIDVIISGHSHSVLEEPIIVKNTIIMCSGCYGYYTGSAHLKQNKKGRWEVSDYKLIEMDSSIEEDPETLKEIAVFAAKIDDRYLKDFGYTAEQVVATNAYSFESVDDMYFDHREHRLGNLITDAYRYAVNATPSGMEHLVDVAVTPAGTVRDTYYPGDITIADVFGSFSLGSGADGTVGYPLISFYLTGQELKTVAEIDASVSDLMESARLYMSGLGFSFNPHRMILNRMNDIWLNEALMSSSKTKISNKKMYRVVTDMYSGMMLQSVTDVSKGLLHVEPKFADGTPVTDFNDVIVYQADGRELKAWDAIAQYMQSFEKDENGISRIPEYYSVTHERKIVDDSRNPISLFKRPNRFGMAAFGIVVLLLLIIVLIVRALIRRRRRKKQELAVPIEKFIDVEVIEPERKVAKTPEKTEEKKEEPAEEKREEKQEESAEEKKEEKEDKQEESAEEEKEEKQEETEKEKIEEKQEQKKEETTETKEESEDKDV